jgi:hypothetical protein
MTAACDLEKWVIKQLIQDIEATGKTLKEVNILNICKTQKLFYGASASLQRCQVQRRFDKLGTRSIQSWADYLDELNVAYGLATTRLLREKEISETVE